MYHTILGVKAGDNDKKVDQVGGMGAGMDHSIRKKREGSMLDTRCSYGCLHNMTLCRHKAGSGIVCQLIVHSRQPACSNDIDTPLLTTLTI